jgi:signal transduction histidine kinase
MRLTAKIMCVVLATVVLFTAAASYFSVRSVYEEFRVQQQQFARQVGQQLDPRAAAVWQQQGLPGILRLLDEVPLPRGRGITVRWVWFERNTAPAQTPHGHPESWTAIRSGEVVSIISQDHQGRRQLHTYQPIQVENGRSGGLEISDSLAEVERRAHEIATSALLTIGGLAFVCIGVAYVTGLRWVARPLGSLIDKTKRIGDGDFSQPLQLHGHDELSQLAEAVNQMCDKLASQQERIVSESTQRLAALHQLRHADRLKTVGRLAAGLAHELGTPLNVVAGRAGLIASGKLSSSEVESSARVIKSEADRITGIVRQLLDFARQCPPRRSSIDLNDLVQRTMRLLQPLADKKQIALCFQPLTPPLVAAVDQGQLQQVLTNIVMNAIHAMNSQGAISVDLSDVARTAENSPELRRWARISIQDQGPGIPREIQEHLFEPFFTTKDVGEGTGLGLSIAYGIVQEHGGWLDVHSEPGQGARFDVYLPLEPR